MGLFDVLTGKTKIKKPAPDRLFAMATAGVTLDTALMPTTRSSKSGSASTIQR